MTKLFLILIAMALTIAIMQPLLAEDPAPDCDPGKCNETPDLTLPPPPPPPDCALTPPYCAISNVRFPGIVIKNLNGPTVNDQQDFPPVMIPPAPLRFTRQ
jgi:hypothetical protein